MSRRVTVAGHSERVGAPSTVTSLLFLYWIPAFAGMTEKSFTLPQSLPLHALGNEPGNDK